MYPHIIDEAQIYMPCMITDITLLFKCVNTGALGVKSKALKVHWGFVES